MPYIVRWLLWSEREQEAQWQELWCDTYELAEAARQQIEGSPGVSDVSIEESDYTYDTRRKDDTGTD